MHANLETPIPSIAVKQPPGEEKVFWCLSGNSRKEARCT